jgi:hypothetical protein
MIESPKLAAGTINLSSLFQPDIVTTQQFHRVFRSNRHCEPEKRLMFAVLSDAVECFQRYRDATSPTHRKLSEDAKSWIQSEDSNWPYSFERICEVLSINPRYLRVGLMRWRATFESQKNAGNRLRAPLRYQYRVKRRRVCI